jgi:hypothetical protein
VFLSSPTMPGRGPSFHVKRLTIPNVRRADQEFYQRAANICDASLMTPRFDIAEEHKHKRGV